MNDIFFMNFNAFKAFIKDINQHLTMNEYINILDILFQNFNLIFINEIYIAKNFKLKFNMTLKRFKTSSKIEFIESFIINNFNEYYTLND